MILDRSVKNAMRTIKTYCDTQKGCSNCDVCYLLRNVSPPDWDIEELGLELTCVYEDRCAAVVMAHTKMQEAISAKRSLIIENECLKAQRTALEKFLDEKVPNWKTEIGGRK